MNTLNKIILLNKESNISSREVVNKLQKILNIKKIGHTGTLDPLATGLLVCLTNKYTKLVSILTSYEKEYIAEIKLGIDTDTLDITGNILKKVKIKHYNKKEIIKVLNSFKGQYTMEVPLYSAIHVQGKRLYEYARNNIEVKLPKKNVFIKDIKLLNYQNNIIKFQVVVSKGTYIRSLIRDICKKLNTIGVMNSLIRIRQGKFNLKDAYTLNDIKENDYQSLDIEDILNIKKVNINNNDLLKKVINGNQIKENNNGYILYIKDNLNVALYYFKDNIGNLKIMY